VESPTSFALAGRVLFAIEGLQPRVLNTHERTGIALLLFDALVGLFLDRYKL